jgi:hypothetical protein
VYDWGDRITFCGLSFWHSGQTFALGRRTNGDTNVGDSFTQPAEGRCALNNGDPNGFVFTAFQVLLVRPIEGLCAL